MSQSLEIPAELFTHLSQTAALSNEQLANLNPDQRYNYLTRLRDVLLQTVNLPAPTTPPASSELQQQFHNLNEELQTLRIEGQGLEARLATTEQDLARANATITSLNNALANTAAGAATRTGTSKKASIPSPEKFDGTMSKYRPFATQLRMKLRGDHHRFEDEQHRLAYAIGLLTGPAFLQIQPNITSVGINFTDTEALLKELESAFGDPNRVATAERGLKDLAQKNRTFVEYLADFQRLAADTEWNDAAKRNALYRGLSSELKDALQNIVDQPDDLTEYSNMLKKLDNNIRARNADKKGSSSSSWRTPVATQPRQTTPAPAVTTATGTAPGPMDISSGRRALTDAQRQERMRRGLCLYCGGHGHMARECPNKRPRHIHGAALYPFDPPTVPEHTRPEFNLSEN